MSARGPCVRRTTSRAPRPSRRWPKMVGLPSGTSDGLGELLEELHDGRGRVGGKRMAAGVDVGDHRGAVRRGVERAMGVAVPRLAVAAVVDPADDLDAALL